MTIRLLILLASLCFAPFAFAASKDGRPNILLIVADDLGYADLGVYGGDIETPNIDALAAEGILFTQFHTSPLCAPTRAMLLSGNNNHVAGMASQGQTGVGGAPVAGYENQLSDRIVPFPRLLQGAGYDTYTVGKWHLGKELENSPHAAGFSRSFNLLQGAGTHFDAIGFAPGGSHFRDGQDLAEYPTGQYSTDFYTEKLISYIETDRSNEKPFFAFAAYTSPHWPMQVPDEYLDLYDGHYDNGYDALRIRRFESLKEARIIPLKSELPPRNDAITPWEDLSPEEQRRESRKMELYASMVDNLDDHIGRLIDYLKENGLYDNTLIVFMADNGAAAEDFYNDDNFPDFKAHTQANFDNTYEKMGTSASFVSYGPQWAEAGSAPFQRHKGYTREGGMVAPMIINGAGVADRGIIDSSYATVMDLAPTFLEIAGAEYPSDGSVMPMLGESMTDFLAGKSEAIHDNGYVTVLSHRGRAFVRKGTWKIVTTLGPFDEADFEMYNLSVDPGETNDLRYGEPEIFAELLEIWRTERHKYGIILPEDL